MLWSKLKSNPIFAREEMRIRRRSFRWILIFMLAWVPFNFFIRQFVGNQNFGLISYLLHYLHMLLRPDMFFAIIIGWSLAHDLLNKELRTDLRLTELSSNEVVSGKVLPYIFLMIAFQYAGILATYYDFVFDRWPNALIPVSNETLQNIFGTSIEIPTSSFIVFFAVIEDCLYATLALIIFARSFLIYSNFFKAFTVGVLQMSLVLIPTLFSSVTFSFVIIPFSFSILLDDGLFMFLSNAWFFISMLPFEMILIFVFYTSLKSRYRELYSSDT